MYMYKVRKEQPFTYYRAVITSCLCNRRRDHPLPGDLLYCDVIFCLTRNKKSRSQPL